MAEVVAEVVAEVEGVMVVDGVGGSGCDCSCGAGVWDEIFMVSNSLTSAFYNLGLLVCVDIAAAIITPAALAYTCPLSSVRFHL